MNEQVVHGIPSSERVLRDGDIVSIDCGVVLDGYYGDSAITVPVGSRCSAEDQAVAGRDQGFAGDRDPRGACRARRWEISAPRCRKWSRRAASAWFVILSAMGLGRGCTKIRRFRTTVSGEREPNCAPGMVLAIEPMVNVGKPGVQVLSDGWTAVTEDGSLSAHFEHTVAVTAEGAVILTQ